MKDFETVIKNWLSEGYEFTVDEHLIQAAQSNSYVIAKDGPAGIDDIGMIVSALSRGADNISWVARSFPDEIFETAKWMMGELNMWMVLYTIIDDHVEAYYSN